jgi:hypothetical protein
MSTEKHPRIYDGEGDALMRHDGPHDFEHVMLVPDSFPSKVPDRTRRLRIMWGQHLLEDLLSQRYRSLVCAVNADDNSHGIITQLASLLPTSQWDHASITAHAKQFSAVGDKAKVIKYDMDMVEVLAILRPATHQNLTMDDLAKAFRIVAEMIQRKPGRYPSASVSFLDARANALIGTDGKEPSFETVLRTMHEAGYTGDVYPSPSMWRAGETGVFARYPFAGALERMRGGGF